jgi:hypothetical protein
MKGGNDIGKRPRAAGAPSPSSMVIEHVRVTVKDSLAARRSGASLTVTLACSKRLR